jgi:hypothetical protein
LLLWLLKVEAMWCYKLFYIANHRSNDNNYNFHNTTYDKDRKEGRFAYSWCFFQPQQQQLDFSFFKRKCNNSSSSSKNIIHPTAK